MFIFKNMEGTEIVIKIEIIYFLGIIGSLILIVWRGGLKLGNIENSLKWLKEGFEKVESRLGSLEVKKSGMENPGSPVDPTKKGWKYLKESGLDKIIDEEKREDLLKILKDSLPENYTKYDVQEKARIVVLNLRDDTEVGKKMEEYAFDNGISVDILLRLGGLLLRDNFLERKHNVAPPPSQ